MKRTKISRILTGLFLFSSCFLTACTDPIQNLKPTIFTTHDLDRSLQSRIVEIISLMPAHAAVDNSYNHYLSADLAGLAVGSVFSLGGVVFGLNGMALGWYLGASLGQGLGGAIVPPALYPKSLIIVFKDPLDPQIHQTVEIARPCEFKLGHAYAVLTAHSKKLETKIQPNNFQACVKKAGEIKANRKAGISTDFSLAETEDQLQLNPDYFLPPLGQAVISKLSNPAYHSPYLESEKNQILPPKPALTKKQIRILKRHKTLHQESFPAFLTSPPMGMEHVSKVKKIRQKA